MVAGWKADRLRWGCAWADRGDLHHLGRWGQSGAADPRGKRRRGPLMVTERRCHRLWHLRSEGGHLEGASDTNPEPEEPQTERAARFRWILLSALVSRWTLDTCG